MEILESTGKTIPRLEYDWDRWLLFDGHPRLLERPRDFLEVPQAFKRQLVTEAAKRGLDITASIKKGDRVMYQVFDPSGEMPVLPDLSDARRKYPWATWLDGQEHEIVKGRDFDCAVSTIKAHAYKMARAQGLKVQLHWPFADTATIRAYKTEEI